jgi:hypothetical protein
VQPPGPVKGEAIWLARARAVGGARHSRWMLTRIRIISLKHPSAPELLAPAVRHASCCTPMYLCVTG